MNHLSRSILAVTSAALLAGCHKHATEELPASTPQNGTASTTPASAPAEQAPDQAAQPVPPSPAPVAVADPQTGLSQAEQAMKARDYDKAAATLVALQQQQMTDQQAMAVHQQMVQLQSALVSAIAK